MRRLAVPEIEDQPWCPRAVRDGGTDWLRFMADTARAFDPIAPKLERAFTIIGERRVLDLCSGGGGPWLSLSRALPNTTIELSDLYPNVRAFEALLRRGAIGFRREPVDATNVPPELTGVRTMFNAFHHLPPPLARAVLQDAVTKGRPIGIFEGLSHRGVGMAFVALQLPALFLLTPFVRPFRFSRLALTYLLPLIPLLVAFDGAMSMLRLYLQDELHELVASLDGYESFDWDIGVTKAAHLPIGVLHLMGTPRA